MASRMDENIFINYRRGEDQAAAGRLYDQLEAVFPREHIFIDVDSIMPGRDFTEELARRVAECDIFLAVIGRRWADVVDSNGGRRLDNPNDWVRIEIESAQRLGKHIIPVLVDGAEMPRPEKLPESLQPFTRRNAARLSHERFRADAQGLISVIGKLREAERAKLDAEAKERARLEAAERAQANETPLRPPRGEAPRRRSNARPVAPRRPPRRPGRPNGAEWPSPSERWPCSVSSAGVSDTCFSARRRRRSRRPLRWRRARRRARRARRRRPVNRTSPRASRKTTRRPQGRRRRRRQASNRPPRRRRAPWNRPPVRRRLARPNARRPAAPSRPSAPRVRTPRPQDPPARRRAWSPKPPTRPRGRQSPKPRNFPARAPNRARFCAPARRRPRARPPKRLKKSERKIIAEAGATPPAASPVGEPAPRTAEPSPAAAIEDRKAAEPLKTALAAPIAAPTAAAPVAEPAPQTGEPSPAGAIDDRKGAEPLKTALAAPIAAPTAASPIAEPAPRTIEPSPAAAIEDRKASEPVKAALAAPIAAPTAASPIAEPAPRTIEPSPAAATEDRKAAEPVKAALAAPTAAAPSAVAPPQAVQPSPVVAVEDRKAAEPAKTAPAAPIAATPAGPPSAVAALEPAKLDAAALTPLIVAELRRLDCYKGAAADWGAVELRIGVDKYAQFAKFDDDPDRTGSAAA